MIADTPTSSASVAISSLWAITAAFSSLAIRASVLSIVLITVAIEVTRIPVCAAAYVEQGKARSKVPTRKRRRAAQLRCQEPPRPVTN